MLTAMIGSARLYRRLWRASPLTAHTPFVLEGVADAVLGRPSSPKTPENPFGKGQLAVRCIWIGQCAPSGELDVRRDHRSQKGG